MATKNVVKKKPGAVQRTETGVIAGLEGVEQDMLIIPRLKLVQKNSVEIDDDLAKPGQIVNSVTKDVINKVGKNGNVTIIPIKNTRTRILFKPFNEGGGLLCQSFDGVEGTGDPGGDCSKCPMNQWETNPKTKKQESPKCTELLNIFCLVRGYDFPIPLTASFGRTSMGAGKQLVNFFWADAQKAQKSPWNFAYELSTQSTENEFGKFYIFKVTPGGMAKAPEIKQGEVFYRLITETQVQIHEDEEEIHREADNIVKEEKKKKEPVKDEPVPGFDEGADEDPFPDEEE